MPSRAPKSAHAFVLLPARSASDYPVGSTDAPDQLRGLDLDYVRCELCNVELLQANYPHHKDTETHQANLPESERTAGSKYHCGPCNKDIVKNAWAAHLKKPSHIAAEKGVSVKDLPTDYSKMTYCDVCERWITKKNFPRHCNTDKVHLGIFNAQAKGEIVPPKPKAVKNNGKGKGKGKQTTLQM